MWHRYGGYAKEAAGYGLMAMGGIEDVGGVAGALETGGTSLALDVLGTEEIGEGEAIVEEGAAENASANSVETPSRARVKINRQQGPREITRIDRPREGVPGSQWHAHGENGGALNLDGSVHDDDPGFGRKSMKWLRGHGWDV